LRDNGAFDAHFPWRDIDASPQFTAYVHAALTCATDWLMFLAADEFLNIGSREGVQSFLSRFPPDVSCVAVNWRNFGSAGQTSYAPGLTIERFNLASSPTAPVDHHVKSFLRPKLAESVPMHAPLMREGADVMAWGATGNGSPGHCRRGRFLRRPGQPLFLQILRGIS